MDTIGSQMAGQEQTYCRAGIDPDAIGPFCLRYGIRFLVVFGSCATGDMIDSSDVDLGFIRPNEATGPISWTELTQAYTVDAHDLLTATPSLRYEVAQSALVAFEAEAGLFHRFRLQANQEFQKVRESREKATRVGTPLSEYVRSRNLRHVSCGTGSRRRKGVGQPSDQCC